MMMRLVTAFAIAAGLAAPAMAQTAATTNMEILRQKIKADKKLVVAAEPEAHRRGRDGVLARVQRVPERPAADQPAPDRGDQGVCRRVQQGAGHQRSGKETAGQALAIDDAEAKLKSASSRKILAVLPATKAARYIQIENKIRAAVRYELAAGIPLVE